jgi:hypothetical protein
MPSVRKGEKMIYSRIMTSIPSGLSITKGTTPVVYFGKYDSAKSCTISINPSDREFCDKQGEILCDTKARLCSRKQLCKKDTEVLNKNEAESVIQFCNEYFQRRPYRSWFDKYERLLNHFDLSYYNGSVVHLDLVQWATTPFWNKIDPDIRKQLLEEDLPFLQKLLEKGFETIFLNGKTVVNEVCKHLKINLKEIVIKEENMAFSVYIGEYKKSKVIGWSTYLQSPAVGGYNNIDKIAEEIKRKTICT